MANHPDTFKTNAVFQAAHDVISKQMEAIKVTDDQQGISTDIKGDHHLLALAATNELLNQQSIAIATLLKKLPDTDTEHLRNDVDDPMTGSAAAIRLMEQTTHTNLVHRHVEKAKLTQIQTSGDKVTNVSLIHDINTFGPTDEVKEGILKTLPDFSADDESSQEATEQALDMFLERFVATVLTSNLSATASQALLYRKLSGTALVLLKDYMKIQSPRDEGEKLRIMIYALEQRFLISANPTLASARLRKIQKGNLTYAQLQAKISKLALYCTLDEHESRRSEVSQEKGLTQFKLAISETDRLLLHNEDKQRLKTDLPPLTLMGASMFLEAHYNEKNVYHSISHNMEQMGTTESHINNMINQHVNNRFQPKNPEDNYDTYQRNNWKQGKNYTNNKNIRPTQKYHAKTKPTNESLGLEKNSCLLCGLKGHFYQKCRRYPNMEPHATLCKTCNKGAHTRYLCKQQDSNNQKKFNKGTTQKNHQKN